jgi:Dyp-type peroxidase family
MIYLDQKTEALSKDDVSQLEASGVLDNIQGNILQGHGRDYSIQILIEFHDGHEHKQNIRNWIKKLANEITSAKRQMAEAHHFRCCGISGQVFHSFSLSARGYRYLGYQRWANKKFEYLFQIGMANEHIRNALNDPEKTCLDQPYDGNFNIDAMLLVADDDEQKLTCAAHKLLDDIANSTKNCAVEHGHVIRNEKRQSQEHFGYVDNISQPSFFETDKPEDVSKWNPIIGPSLVLVQDPCSGLAGQPDLAYGSYLVYRKLEQDVIGFQDKIKELANQLEIRCEERAAALVMGRYRDGTPLSQHDMPSLANSAPNHFNYEDDPDGNICPYHAHIRLMNNRNTGGEFKPASRFIARRGIPYGPDEQSKVGLHFMCYQSSIRGQFWSLQLHYANSRPLDPIIGQPIRGQQRNEINTGQKWPWLRAHQSCHFHSFVSFKGGEFLFTPSISFLKKLPILSE